MVVVDGFFTNILLNIYVLLLQSLSKKFKLLNSGVFGVFVALGFFVKGECDYVTWWFAFRMNNLNL